MIKNNIKPKKKTNGLTTAVVGTRYHIILLYELRTLDITVTKSQNYKVRYQLS